METEKTKFDLDIEKDKAKIKALQEKLNKKLQKKSNQERTVYTRKKIIAGAFLIEESGQWETILKSDKFDKFVTRPIDRKLFGLEVTDEVTKETPESEGEKVTVENKDKDISKHASADVASEKQIGFIKQLIAKTGKNIKDFDNTLDQDSLDSLPKDKAGPLIDWLKIQ